MSKRTQLIDKVSDFEKNVQDHGDFFDSLKGLSLRQSFYTLKSEKLKMDEKKAGNGTQKLTKKQTLIQTVKFALFSASAGIIQAVTFTLLNEVAHLKYWPSYLTALVLSVLWNFTFNRKFTFKSANNIPIAMLKVAGYYCVFTPLSTYLGNLCAETYVVNEYIVLAVTMVTNLVTEYLFCRFVVYRNSMNTNDIARKEKAKEASDAESKND